MVHIIISPYSAWMVPFVYLSCPSCEAPDCWQMLASRSPGSSCLEILEFFLSCMLATDLFGGIVLCSADDVET